MAYAIQEELGTYGLRRSYNRLGHCTDNAHMESFYHSLKRELMNVSFLTTCPIYCTRLTHTLYLYNISYM